MIYMRENNLSNNKAMSYSYDASGISNQTMAIR